MKKTFFIIATIIMCFSCQQKIEKNNPLLCLCPPIIYLQPVNNFTQAEAELLISKINQVIEDATGDKLEIVVLPTLQLQNSLQNNIHTRYRADNIIKSIKDNPHDVIIVITHEDISCSYKGNEDWGILGLSMYPKHVCVASDYRLKNKKRDFHKVITHEFFHSYFGLHHCPNDNKYCIMKDAKGHADFSNKNKLCDKCKSLIK